METTIQATLDTILEDLLGVEHADLFPEENQERLNSMDIARQIATIKKLEEQIQQYELQEKEAKSFYAQRRAKCDDRIGFLKGSIKAFLDQQGLKNIQTPNGTAYQKVVTVKQWPDDEALLAWADVHLPTAIRVKREPDKRAIGEHIAKTGDVPEMYREEHETRVYIR